ncbi:mechanosensitive ion channel family protein [Salinibius halmophilus]|uniref:mechanosensitive ion channel family protein n=1 Tax=Salinibius halmophilus TaxID=1853216 RepID=UPI000E673DD9|nr:mechanosensitive ion channel domain-containing protein [Salinibius halmophilus]
MKALLVFLLALSSFAYSAQLIRPLAQQWPELPVTERSAVVNELYQHLNNIAERSEVAEIQGLLGDAENLLSLISSPLPELEVELFSPELKQVYHIADIENTLQRSQQYSVQKTRLQNELTLLNESIQTLETKVLSVPSAGSTVSETVAQLEYLKHNSLLIYRRDKQTQVSNALQTLADEQAKLSAWLAGEALTIAPSEAEVKWAQAQAPVLSTPSNLMGLVSIIGINAQQLLDGARQQQQLKRQLIDLYQQPDDEQFTVLRQTMQTQRGQLDDRRAVIQQAIEANGDVGDETVMNILLSARRVLSEQEQAARLNEFLIKHYPVQFQTLAERQVGELMAASQLSWQGVKDLLAAFFGFELIKIGAKPLTVGGLLWLLTMLAAAWLLHRAAKRGLHRMAQRSQSFTESSVFTVDRLLFYALMTAAVFLSLSVLGIDLTKFALVAGALSVGIGFGLQSIFSNFVSGLILLFERPVKVGDLIELESGVMGKVKAINVRSTQVTTPDNIDVLVPNSEFVNGRVTNFTFDDPQRRLHIKFSVAYGTDKELVREVVVAAAETVPYTVKTTERSPDVWLVNLGESGLDFELIVWIDVRNMPLTHGISALYLWEVESALTAAGLTLPVPRRDIQLLEKAGYK